MAELIGLLCVVSFIGLIMAIVLASASTRRVQRQDAVQPSRHSEADPWPPASTSASATSSQPVAPATADECWVPPGHSVPAGQWTIPCGMVYVGRNLPAPVDWWGAPQEPALLNPDLPVAPPGTNRYADLPYWPQYAELDPQQRSAVLDWLAGGRSDPHVDLGCVFVCFYGLERRIVVDALDSATAAAEVPALVQELERLLSIYGGSNSFRRYASQLLLFARIAYVPGNHNLTVDSVGELDPHVNVALGQLVKEGQPLPADLALIWYLHSEERRLRTPARRCWNEFVRLFRLRYAEQLGDGIVVKPNKTPLRVPYMPASPGLTPLANKLVIPVGDLPDVMRLKRPVRKIAQLADECMDELDPYSRFLGRNPDGAGSIQAVALLPPEIAADHQGNETEALRGDLEAALGDAEMTSARADLLFDHWPAKRQDRMTKKEGVGLMQLLDKLGYGAEPDPRFGGSIRRDNPVVLFRQTADGGTRSPSDEYAGAMLVLHLAALVASADGSVDESEKHVLEQHLEESLALSPGERLRLRAHLRWLVESGPGFAGLKKKLEALDSAGRRSVAELAVAIAAADGHIDPNEVKVLRRVYSMLGFEADEVHSAVHETRVAEPAREPVPVRAGSKNEGYRIPEHASEASGEGESAAASLDMSRVRQKIQETAQVSALLSDIFEEDEPEEAPAASSHLEAESAQADTEALDGLDVAQTAFLRALESKDEWTQDELEALADEHGVLLEGTIDAINDVSFERVDEPAIEWDEPVEIHTATIKELFA